MRKLPDTRTTAYALLRQLAASPGTFYQLCERADIDIESDRAEQAMRTQFHELVQSGHAHMVGLVYHITTPALRAINPPTPYVGQVAGPAYRGKPQYFPTLIVRRPAEARA